MIRLSVGLPKQYRLDVGIVQRRGPSVGKSLLPSIRDIFNIRRGSRLSRVFAHIITHKSIKKLLGANIAGAIIISSFIPTYASFDEVELNVVSAQNIITKTEKGIQYPLEETKVNQGYRAFHPGVDFDGNIKDPVKPIMAGIVKATQYSRFAYGNAILIDHGGGLSSLYAHLSKIDVNEGQEVAKTTEIGQVGISGYSTGSHLHLEILQDERPLNPFSVLPR